MGVLRKAEVLRKDNLFYWAHIVMGDTGEGPIVCVGREEVLQLLNEMTTGIAAEPSDFHCLLLAEK